MDEKEYNLHVERQISRTEQTVLDTLSKGTYDDLNSFFEAVQVKGIKAQDARAAIWQLISEGRIELDDFRPTAAEAIVVAPKADLVACR